MDSHRFVAEPVWDASIPTWTIWVYRHGVDEAVGSLVINQHNLPPRRNRRNQKVVWKLPSDYQAPVTFGSHEQERLWELFKQQKKERRKKLKDPSNEGAVVDEEQDSVETETPPMEPSFAKDFKGAEQKSENGKRSGQEEEQSANKAPLQLRHENMRPEDTSSSRLEHDAQVQVATTLGASETTTAWAATTTTISGSLFPLTTAPPPPPPPGFDRIALRLLEEPTTITGSYFSVADVTTLGTLVASTFAQLLSTGSVEEWLNYSLSSSSETTTTVSTLLMGSAQAVSSSREQRRALWQPLSQKPWNITGWTSQPVTAAATTTKTTAIVMVMVGTTLQPQGLFEFHLTLVLASVLTSAGYQNSNEILGLSLVRS